MSASEYLRESILEPEKFRPAGVQGEMPRGLTRKLSDGQLLSLIAYLESQQGTVAYRELLRLPRQPVEVAEEPSKRLSLDSIERGRELYLGKLQCALCHPFDGLPGTTLLAPSLAKTGYQSRDYLRQALLKPGRQIVPGYVRCLVSQDGKVLQGRRLAQTQDEIRLLTVNDEGGLKVLDFSLNELDPLDEDRAESVVVQSGISSMPDYSRTITPQELEALLDFLATMR